jgi:hypothetical protein
LKYRKGKAFTQCLLPAFQNLSEPFPFECPKIGRGCATAMVSNNFDSSTGEIGGPRSEVCVTPVIVPEDPNNTTMTTRESPVRIYSLLHLNKYILASFKAWTRWI